MTKLANANIAAENEPESTPEDTMIVLSDNEPEQSGEHPKWKYPKRVDPKWGTITKRGLIIGNGDNQKVIPPDDVYMWASLGCTDQEIANWFMIPVNTLKYNFAEYMEKGRTELKHKLRRAQTAVALGGNPTMLIWLGKNLLGQSDIPVNSEQNQPLPWAD